jgi:tetratricopeptide (TPR) repeat protein
MCYFDLKNALKLDPNNEEGSLLLEQLKSTGEDLRNSGLVLSLNNRVQDAINKMTGAITFNPEKSDYHLQRGILYKRMRDFNSAIDDFLLGLEKMQHDESKDPILFNNFQRQILLTYNDFAIQCYEKKFYDDAITLLNKAIKIEKGEKGFYVNRGDCFFKKDDRKFALLDYEQANEIDPDDEDIKNRIAKVYYEFGVESYNEKEYEVFSKF